jgi:uncharacterized integral membrane protein
MNGLFYNEKGAIGIKTVLTIILLSVFAVFILQNAAVVEIRFLLWELKMSRVILLLGAFFIGMLTGLFIGFESSAQKKKDRIGKSKRGQDLRGAYHDMPLRILLTM